ncbi:unnamed protein product [Gongylonema pulchrum]|uniref:GPS domain-containing protein n=1 Tax=Gongylonema pulchrum TaxID=637853 RepID=A0A183CWJ9_9BILA|nr:unnamed protein product [Gongylonema pulchrum]
MVAPESYKTPRDKDGSDISVSMSDALKSIFGEIVQKSSTVKNVAQREDIQPGSVKQRQNISTGNKSKRALSGVGSRNVYELRLKIAPNVNIMAPNFHRDLLLALKNFALFSDSNKHRQLISGSSPLIKITKMQKDGEYLRVQYSVEDSSGANWQTSDCSVNKVNGKPGCSSPRKSTVDSIEWIFFLIGIVAAVLILVGAFLVRNKKCGKTMVSSHFLSLMKCSLQQSGFRRLWTAAFQLGIDREKLLLNQLVAVRGEALIIMDI